ncbi:amidohydrolase [Mailhella massiliensis]|uniref:amidohydrolase n=1 Tax=Mailhella massiliensis TaxID=1903261 RepID=UPI00097D35D2|nr:amidohydrolase [Mailhella massiliensis]
MTEQLYDAIERRAEKFQRLADSIWDYAELGFTETRSCRAVTKALEEEGFTVEKGIAGMPTAFRASFTHGQGGPVIGFLAEYDALPMLSQQAGAVTPSPVVEGGPGHGCGHNSMAPMQALAVSALKQVLVERDIPATLVVFGTPAEELLACKGFMARDGVFDGLDAVIDCHSNSFMGTSFGLQNNALFSFLVEFYGKTAHAGSRPWEGRSAADAVELMHAGTERLREHMLPEQRVHWATLSGISAPNVVPDYARTWYYVRSQDPVIQALYERIRLCARGAALMTGTEERITFLAACHQRYPNEALARALYANMLKVGAPEYSEEEHAFARALQHSLGAPEVGMQVETTLVDATKAPFKGDSSDVGDVTLKAPTASLQFPTWVPGAKAHTWAVTACQKSSIMHKGLVTAARVAALTALDLITRPELLAEVRREFESTTAAHPYVDYLDAEARPPLSWHEEDMALFRPLLDAALGTSDR